MSTAEKIKTPVAAEMQRFEKEFRNSMHTNVPLLDRITRFILQRKGKQMRPLFVLLVSKMIHNKVSEESYRGAALIELMHTASLVHDDVVDDSDMRRGLFSINALWKNKVAVLVGDFLLSKGLLLSVENEDFDMLKIISQAMKDMSEGELLQIEKARHLDITEDVYYEIVRKKTAALIAACCAMGGHKDDVNDELVKKMHRFGELVGMAFQIKDDLFDYGEEKIGKPTGIDIKEQKMTLPLIYSINNADKKTRKWIINIVKRHNNNKKKVKELIEYVKQNGGIEYTQNKMLEYRDEALQLISEFEDSESKQALVLMVNYVVERKI